MCGHFRKQIIPVDKMFLARYLLNIDCVILLHLPPQFSQCWQ